MSAPFFSVIIPTRNRLDMLKLSLSSLVKQDFKDFEIIISDNSDAVGQCLNFAYIKTLGLSNLIYKKPDIILTMHDHWEFALNGAKGLYQGVLIDKTLLRNKALSALFQILTNDHEIDILNYLQIGIEYHPKRLFKYKIQSKIVDDFSQAIDYFSPKVEISKKFNFSKNIFSDKSSYVLGKICFGFYKKDLISKVIS
ncbi:MAG: glycosyltransferase family A protein, partial [Rickettsia endosymbiont of Ixodes persulcatus]|nr:glycosyltransferase family A protein [Rickettsia endosymbiont of Ixodes persulcatus]